MYGPSVGTVQKNYSSMEEIKQSIQTTKFIAHSIPPLYYYHVVIGLPMEIRLVPAAWRRSKGWTYLFPQHSNPLRQTDTLVRPVLDQHGLSP